MFHKTNLPLQETFLMIRGLARGNYPNFVLGSGLNGQIPIFYYHRVVYAEFSEHLAHLQRNGYFTLTADEYYRVIREGKVVDPKTVVLTFDDGLDDLFTVAYPLLKKYGFKAVAFIIPEWIGKKGMITWEQARKMHESGLIDFQSHSLHHALIFMSEEIVDFLDGRLMYPPWETPLVRRNEEDKLMESPELGAPIFKSASRLSDHRRFFPNPPLEVACMETVRKAGGKQFFSSINWRKKLMGIANSYKSSRGYYESVSEQREAIKQELILSKQRIEEKLPGKSVRHFSFPWSQTGKMAKALLPECGYDSAYSGLPSEKMSCASPKHLYETNRVSGDFVLRLPGVGRSSLAWILLYKIKRRFLQDSTFF